ncbi:hypothetical protein PUN4_120034 [Paraburkholderia unamae]|nr:hypothetical protein PUN4_120034 [Paraburkholderia unamae]
MRPSYSPSPASSLPQRSDRADTLTITRHSLSLQSLRRSTAAASRIKAHWKRRREP